MDATATGRGAIYDDYGTNLLMTGDILVNLTTSAGCTYTPTTVTYADNTQEEVEFVTMPYPVFTGAAKVAFQRGGGMCIFSSNNADGAARADAAAVFLKWLTRPENNIRFTVLTGYMPVTVEAFGAVMEDALPEDPVPIVARTIATVTEMQKDYSFFTPPAFDGSDAVEKNFNQKMLREAREARDAQEAQGTEGDAE